MAYVEVRGVKIGEGTPKICVPIVGKTKEEIYKEASTFDKIPLDLVEWRVDWFFDALNLEKVLEAAQGLRDILKDIPILFTFRTAKEGGAKDISMEDYIALNKGVAASGLVDLIDVEAFSGEEVVKEIIAAAHENAVKIVASNHDFQATPKKDELVRRLTFMQEIGADIPKIAVMPQSKRDVITLLAATEEMSTDHPETPIITMSMSGRGVISRVCGEVFGSALTFGAAGQISAPGQMGVGELKTVLELLHASC